MQAIPPDVLDQIPRWYFAAGDLETQQWTLKLGEAMHLIDDRLGERRPVAAEQTDHFDTTDNRSRLFRHETRTRHDTAG